MTWKSRLHSLRYVRPLLKLVWETSPPLVVASIAFRLLRALMPLAMLWVPKLIIDAVVAWVSHRGGSLAHIWKLVAMEFGLAVLSDFLSRANSLCDSLLGDRFTNRVSIRLMQHATGLDLATFEDPVFHDNLERARRQTTGRMGLMASILRVGQDMVSLSSLSAGLIVFSPWLMALLVAAVIPAFLGENHYSKLAYSVLHRRTPQRRQLDYLRLLGASAQSAKEVKIFGLGAYLTERYRGVAQAIENENRSLSIRRAIAGSGLNLISTGGYYGAYVAVLARTLAGAITLGMFTFLTGAFSRSRSYIENMLSSFNDITEEAMYLKDLFEFLEIRPSIHSLPQSIPAPRPIRAGFEFQNVTFAYPGGVKPVVQNINFRLDTDEKVALIGQNGAGKTTLVKLLARLYDPTEGRILLDGYDLREYDLAELRKQVGIIFQDYLRYQMTVSQNIAVGDISEKENKELIIHSARQSLADLLIQKLPGKYEQPLGKRFNSGVELSGGEWQKIALARAYMKDAQLFILDEPTSALDARAEYEVFQRFSELTKGKTAVLISHRFSTVRMADRILVLDKGEILEEGSHGELLNKKNRYAELFNMQAMGYQ